MLDVCDEVVGHEAMNKPEKGVLEVARRIKVASRGDAVVGRENSMRSIRLHNSTSKNK